MEAQNTHTDYQTKLPRATLNQKVEVLDYLLGPPAKSQIDALHYFKNKKLFAISQATLSNWVTHEHELRDEYSSNPNLKSYKKKPVLKYPDVTNKVEKYISDLLLNGNEISDKIIKEAYSKYMQELGYSTSSFKLSTGMLKSFKKRNILNSTKPLHPVTSIPQQNLTNTDTNQINQSSSLQLQNPYDTSPSLDFNFDDIFNNNSIGFNTRLIHSDDTFSLLPTSFSDVNGNFSMPLMMPSNNLNVNIPNNDKLSPLLSASPLIPSFQSNQDIPPLLPKPKNEKHNLPYYPTYNNPLNDSSIYKRQYQHHPHPQNKKNFSNSIGSKLSNPNSEKIEKILENITDGHVTLYNSGTSAIMGILSFINPEHVYIDDEGYKGTHDVIKFLNKLTKVEKHSLLKLHNNSKVLKNSVIIIESPMNPLGYVHDISYYSNIIKLSNENSCKLIVDSTLAPPPLQFPFKNGADYIVYSAVKYLAGVSDLSAGFIVSKDLNSKTILHKERIALGTSIANFDSFLLVRSLRTYKMRILTQCNNTEKIIKYLQKNFSKYNSVLLQIHHASLQPNKPIVMQQLNGFYNPVFALELRNSSYPEKILNKFNYLSNNPNLEGGETLVELIYGNPNFNDDGNENNNNNNNNNNNCNGNYNNNNNNDTQNINDRNSHTNYKKMIRFSVGCEDFQDIIRDIDQALLSLVN